MDRYDPCRPPFAFRTYRSRRERSTSYQASPSSSLRRRLAWRRGQAGAGRVRPCRGSAAPRFPRGQARRAAARARPSSARPAAPPASSASAVAALDRARAARRRRGSGRTTSTPPSPAPDSRAPAGASRPRPGRRAGASAAPRFFLWISGRRESVRPDCRTTQSLEPASRSALQPSTPVRSSSLSPIVMPRLSITYWRRPFSWSESRILSTESARRISDSCSM